MYISCQRLRSPHKLPLFLSGVTLALSLLIHGDFLLTNSFLSNSAIYEKNISYINHISFLLGRDLINVSLVESMLSTIETSTVGIDFIVKANINIGKELASLSNIFSSIRSDIEFFLAISLITEAILTISNLAAPLLLMVLLPILSIYFLSIAFDIHIIHINLSHPISIIFWLFIFCNIIAPYSIHIANYMTNFIINEDQLQAQQHFENIRHEYYSHVVHEDLQQKAKSMLHLPEILMVNIHQKTANLLNHAQYYFITHTVSLIIIPITTFISLLLIARKIFINNFINGNENVFLSNNIKRHN